MKRAVRAELIARRARLPSGERAERSALAAERLEALAELAGARTIAFYAPLGAEVDVLIAARRAARRTTVVFPRAVPGERRLVFARCGPGDLERGPLGAPEPPASAPLVEAAELDCVVMPGVAFSSEDGLRLGRGGGYYDATLALLPRAFRVGIAYDVQLVPALPREPHDAPMDAIVTDRRTLRFARESR